MTTLWPDKLRTTIPRGLLHHPDPCCRPGYPGYTGHSGYTGYTGYTGYRPMVSESLFPIEMITVQILFECHRCVHCSNPDRAGFGLFKSRSTNASSKLDGEKGI